MALPALWTMAARRARRIEANTAPKVLQRSRGAGLDFPSTGDGILCRRPFFWKRSGKKGHRPLSIFFYRGVPSDRRIRVTRSSSTTATPGTARSAARQSSSMEPVKIPTQFKVESVRNPRAWQAQATSPTRSRASSATATATRICTKFSQGARMRAVRAFRGGSNAGKSRLRTEGFGPTKSAANSSTRALALLVPPFVR